MDEQDPLKRYVDVSCEKLVITHFEDALSQLQRWPAEPIRLFGAARSIHSALVAALTSALAGTDGTGAFDENTRIKWLAYFESNDQGFSEIQLKDRVLSFRDLIAKAQTQGGGWLSKPVSINEAECELLERITKIRDVAEHPKPGLGMYSPAYILETLPVAIKFAEAFFAEVRHRLDAIDEYSAGQTIRALKEQVALIIELAS